MTTDELPEGWELSTVGECFRDIRNGTTITQNKAKIGYPVSRIETIQQQRFESHRMGHIEVISDAELSKFKYEIGDIAFSHINSYEHVGKSAIYAGDPPVLVHGMNLLRLRLGHDSLSPEFLHCYFQAKTFREAVRHAAGQAVNQVSINQGNLSTIEVPLPPLAEQRRIVAAVERILGKVSAARARLVRVPTTLKRFRQAVLAAACSGRLTADWRDSGTTSDVRAELARTKQSVNEKDIRHLVRRATVGIPEAELPEVPHSWAVMTVRELVEHGAILDFQDGNHGSLYPRSEDFGNSGVRFLTAQQVFNNEVLFDDAPLLRDEKANLLRIGFVEPRDVLLTHNATVGRVALMPPFSGRVVLGTSVTYYRLNPTVFLPEFLSYQMQAEHWQSQLDSVMEQTTRNQVSVTKQVEFKLFIPPLAEQREIVKRVSALFARADAIEGAVTAARKRVDTLTQAVLAKAFRGELVPTEAELARRENRPYEPAAELLARVRQSAATDAPKPKRPRKQKDAPQA